MPGYQYYFIREGDSAIIRIIAPSLKDAVIRLANRELRRSYSDESFTHDDFEAAKNHLEAWGYSQRSVEEFED